MTLENAELGRRVYAWKTQLARQPRWSEDLSHRRLLFYPAPAFLAGKPVRWAPAPSEFDRFGVVYELASPRGASGLLFVYSVSPSELRLPAAPPARPQSLAAGGASAAWLESNRMYVVSVDGGAGRYRELVGGGGQLAMRGIGPRR